MELSVNSISSSYKRKAAVTGVGYVSASIAYALIDLVQFFEKAITETNVDVVITHHPSDLNNDHVQASIACQAVVRLFQRGTDVTPLKELFSWKFRLLQSVR